jgi:hypothetical protein
VRAVQRNAATRHDHVHMRIYVESGIMRSRFG